MKDGATPADETGSIVVDPDPLAAGWSFSSESSYRLIEHLGRGGMGEVWKAERRSAAGHVQPVAVKFLTDPGSQSRSLDAEALRMSLLSHDNIVPFLDSGIDEAGRFFVAMAFVEGMDLDGLRELVGATAEAVYGGGGGGGIVRIPEQIVGFIVFMVLRALHYAHSFDFGHGVIGLIHRDISPGNILLDERRGFVKLSDFGVAIAQGEEQDGQIAGKVPYMAPEVLIEDPVDARTDIYALGLVTYELLTGFNPNVRPQVLGSVIGTITEVMLSLERPLVPPHEVVEGIDPKCSRIVERMLARRPEDRYQSAVEALGEMSVLLFERGFGPTTSSLASYFRLLRDPDCEPDSRTRQTLRFLDWEGCGVRAVRPEWRLTETARRALEAGDNPARG